MMEQREEGCQNDEAIWETAQQASFLSPPREWTFGANVVIFGANLYHVDEASLYELALLYIHAQYWESNIKEVLRRYYRDLSDLCLLFQHETTGVPQKWESVQALSRSHTWTVAGIPFTESDVNILLDGDWLNDNIIDAYLELCAYLCPDIKFLPTHWFRILKLMGKKRQPS
ncbi:hypothetical protein BYT27DRAFT_7262374 [Phlegmacium glaucopus]|nr:hypothetical protein BYT27DRAFT_7262374 [Phlegmacium glaucopus]